jgi:hypothetical protein
VRRGRSRHELISCWGRGFDPSTLRPLAYPCCLVVYRHCRTCSIPTVSVPRSTASPLVLSRPPNRVSSAGRRGRRRRFRPRSISTGGGGSTLRPFDLCNTVAMIAAAVRSGHLALLQTSFAPVGSPVGGACGGEGEGDEDGEEGPDRSLLGEGVRPFDPSTFVTLSQ